MTVDRAVNRMVYSIIVVHEEARGAHDLKLMYDGLWAGKGVEVGVSCEFLRERDIMGVPG